MFIYLNNEFIDKSNGKISIEDRGFLFGDGIFETILFKNKEIQHFNDHIERLKYGLKTLKINVIDDNLLEICYKLIEKSNLDSGIIKIIITRGNGNNGYLPAPNSKPNIIITINPSKEKPQNVSLAISNYLMPENLPYSGFKTLNSLHYVLAKMEALELGVFDTILLTKEGVICETSSSNIFLIKDNVIYTPSDDLGIVKGIIRKNLLKQKIFNIKPKKLYIEDLQNADEVFITNAISGIISISKIKSIDKYYCNSIINKLRDTIEQGL